MRKQTCGFHRSVLFFSRCIVMVEFDILHKRLSALEPIDQILPPGNKASRKDRLARMGRNSSVSGSIIFQCFLLRRQDRHSSKYRSTRAARFVNDFSQPWLPRCPQFREQALPMCFRCRARSLKYPAFFGGRWVRLLSKWSGVSCHRSRIDGRNVSAQSQTVYPSALRRGKEWGSGRDSLPVVPKWEKPFRKFKRIRIRRSQCS